MYIPEPVPLSGDLTLYIDQELLRISANFDQIAEGIYWQPRGRAPAKPREGQIVIADGVGWNPGAGAGMYEYKAGSWVKL